MNALILANGEPPSKRLIQILRKESSLFVCADGGANIADRLKLRPDAIIGDLDSVFASTLKRFPQAKHIRISDQDSTDLEKAVKWVIDEGYRNISIVGAEGRRLDHTVGNLGVLVKFNERAKITFVSDEGELRYVGKNLEFRADAGTLISLIPLNRCEGVTTTGLQYALSNDMLELGVREGLSNVVVSNPIRISVEKGNLLVFRRFRHT